MEVAWPSLSASSRRRFLRDEVGAFFALMLGMFVTWASYELYHQMRAFEFFSAPWLGYGFASVAAAFVGGALIKAGAS